MLELKKSLLKKEETTEIETQETIDTENTTIDLLPPATMTEGQGVETAQETIRETKRRIVGTCEARMIDQAVEATTVEILGMVIVRLKDLKKKLHLLHRRPLRLSKLHLLRQPLL